MQIEKVNVSELHIVKNITTTTITHIYPHYYPQGAVNFFMAHHKEENILKDIQQGRVFLCYDDKNNAVGTVTIKENEICRLFVLPDYQGRGYGRAMLDYAETFIAETYGKIQLDASLPAKKLYAKRGYVVTESQEILCQNGDYLCYDVMTKWIKGMCKQL